MWNVYLLNTPKDIEKEEIEKKVLRSLKEDSFFIENELEVQLVTRKAITDEFIVFTKKDYDYYSDAGMLDLKMPNTLSLFDLESNEVIMQTLVTLNKRRRT